MKTETQNIVSICLEEVYNKDQTVANILYKHPKFFKKNLAYFYRLLKSPLSKPIFKFLDGKKDIDKIINMYNTIDSSYYNRYSKLAEAFFIKFLDKNEQTNIITERIKLGRKLYKGLPTKQIFFEKYYINWSLLKPQINANLFNLQFLEEFNFKKEDLLDISQFFVKYILSVRPEANWIKWRLHENSVQTSDK